MFVAVPHDHMATALQNAHSRLIAPTPAKDYQSVTCDHADRPPNIDHLSPKQSPDQHPPKLINLGKCHASCPLNTTLITPSVFESGTVRC